MHANQGPLTAKQIFDNLPPPLSERELRSLYGASMERMRTLAHEALAHPSTADVAVATVKRAGQGLLRLLDHAADVVAEALQPCPAPAFAASRALGAVKTETAGATCVRMGRKTDSCQLIVTVEASAGGQDMRIRLEDLAGHLLSPMALTVGDAETGKILLSNKAFQSGEALLRKVEPGEYAILAECGDNGANMTIRIEAQPR